MRWTEGPWQARIPVRRIRGRNIPSGGSWPRPVPFRKTSAVSRGLSECRSPRLTRSVVPLCGVDGAIAKS